MTATLDEKDVNVESSSGNLEVVGLRSVAWRWLSVALTGLLVVGGSSAAYLNHRHDQQATAAEKARAVGTEHVEELLSYDYRRIDKDYDAEKEWLTDAFAEKYSPLIDGKFTPAAQKAHLTTQARVVAGGIESADSDEVTLLLFVDIAISRGKSAPAVTGTRLQVTLDRVGGDWLISAIEPV